MLVESGDPNIITSNMIGTSQNHREDCFEDLFKTKRNKSAPIKNLKFKILNLIIITTFVHKIMFALAEVLKHET